jgi:glucosamine-6-phosphate deaminase
MKVIVCDDYEAVSQKAAEIFADRIKAKPDIVLGLATGGTPERLYALLAEKNKASELDFSGVKTFNLDEYAGVEASHDQSYRYFMNDKLFNSINIQMENTNVLNGVADDLAAECASYEDRIKAAGGVDLQLLGIGSNGHIAFNEPGSAKDSRTRVVDLKESTIEDNARFFASADEVPRQALSMGMASIMDAKEIVLIANKESKADAIAKSLEGPVTEEVPASILQEHPNVTIIIDKDAASKLTGSH